MSFKKIALAVKETMGKVVCRISTLFTMEKVTDFYAHFPLKKYIFLQLFVIASGTIINCSAEKPLPFFFPLFFLFLFCIFFSCYTAHYTFRVYEKLQNQTMVGDQTFLILLPRQKARTHNNFIYLPLVFFGILIPTATFTLIGIKISIAVKVFCLAGLSITTVSCTFGAIHYLYLLLFLRNISKKASIIKEYDRSSPQETEWLQDIMSVTQVCNNYFLVVGLMLILAFCLFSFTGSYGIDTSRFVSKVLLVMFWVVIFAFIIIGAIMSAFLSRKYIRDIISGLYNSEIDTLNQNYKYIDDPILKEECMLRLLIVKLGRNSFSWPSHSFFMYLMSIINALASIEATLTLIGIVINTQIPSLISLFPSI